MKSKGPIVLPVTTMDGENHAFNVDSAMGCEDLCIRIRDRLGMTSVYGFSIYVVGLDQVSADVRATVSGA